MSKFYCPVNGWDCPYWNIDGTCKMAPEEALDNCDDVAFFWDDIEEYDAS